MLPVGVDWQPLLIGALNLIVVSVILPLIRKVTRMQTNELRHLQESLDRIERRLDEHIAYHMEKSL